MSNDNITITFTAAQAAALLAIVDDENAATKNRLVTATLSTGDYAEHAHSLALRSTELTTLRAAIARASRS